MQKPAIAFRHIALILGLLILLIALDSQGYLEGTKNATLSFFAPVASRFEGTTGFFGNLSYTISQIDSFKSENEQLQRENRDLSYKLSQSVEVAKENDQLRKQLKFKNDLCAGTDCIDFTAGRITGRGLDGYGKFILTNLGFEDGAKNGEAVTVEGGVMIGKIVEVQEKYSKVMLLTSPDSSINCLTQTTRANGLLRGKYGTGVKLEMIDQSEALSAGDVLITSGLEASIPKGLLLGKLSKVEESPNTVFKSADVELFSDLNHIEEVFLVKPNEG
jgi:rod shape-determining protein MreC